MARNSVTRSVARFTRPLRDLFDRKTLARLTRIPRTLLTGGGISERVIALENRFERLDRGWNEHIPGLLGSMSEALDAARQAEDVHRRLDALREDLDRVSSRLELNLIALRSSGGGDHSGAVTLTLTENRGVVMSCDARNLPVAPGSASAIRVGVDIDLGPDDKALDAVLGEWFDLLTQGGRLEIDRRAHPGSPDLPTDARIAMALGRSGFRIAPPAPAADGAARTFVGLRPTTTGA